MHPRRDHPDQVCGHTLSGFYRKVSDSRFYGCGRKCMGPEVIGACPNVIPAASLEAWVWAQIKNVVHHPDELLAELDAREREQGDTRSQLEREMRAAQAALAAAQEHLDNLVRRNIEGKLDNPTFDRLQPGYIGKRDDALTRVTEAKRALANCDASATDRNALREHCGQLAARLAALEQPGHEEEKDALIRALVVRIEIRDADPSPRRPGRNPARAKHVRLVGLLQAVSGETILGTPLLSQYS